MNAVSCHASESIISGEQETDTVKSVLHKIVRNVSGNLTGLDQQKLIGALVVKLSQDERDLLQTVLENAMTRMMESDASDIDFGGPGCQEHFWYRIHGRKRPDSSLGSYQPVESDILLQCLLTPSQREYLYEHRNLDFSYQIEHNNNLLRYRADLYFDLDHLALNCRFIPDTIRPFKNLNLHPEVVKAMSLKTDKQGLTLITGITGSGKSTSLDSIIDANNKSVDAHIVIIASPVETVHTSARCIVRHREVGRDVRSFKEGAVQALRQDPDIIVIGEMRDPDTIMTALEITDSGHKVFSTLHTGSAVESIDRIIGECPPNDQERVRIRLADTLKCVMSQKLVPAVEGQLILAKEIMLMTPSIRAAILNNNTGEIYQMITEGRTLGMFSMEQDLVRLVREETIAESTAVNHANNKKRVRELLGQRS